MNVYKVSYDSATQPNCHAYVAAASYADAERIADSAGILAWSISFLGRLLTDANNN